MHSPNIIKQIPNEAGKLIELTISEHINIRPYLDRAINSNKILRYHLWIGNL